MSTIYRLPDVKFQSGYSRSTLYERMAEGLWTKPVNLGYRSVGWPAREVAILNAARIAGSSADEIRDLVKQLEFARKDALRAEVAK